MFANDANAEAWVAKRCQPTGGCCPRRGFLIVNTNTKRNSIPLQCREKVCDANFSVKTGTFMQSRKHARVEAPMSRRDRA
ncbi:MAG: hypothetical protein OXJ37_01250 [Bryobacterales bacterium]|nr:hypothetical protein [Bryobacterales bacterium]